MIKILLVADEPSVRRGLRMRLTAEPDVAIVGEAADGRAALELTDRLHPDVVLIDAETPRLGGLAVARSLAARAAMILLSLHDDPVTRRGALEAGAVDFVTKCGSMDDLLTAIRRAASRDAGRRPEAEIP